MIIYSKIVAGYGNDLFSSTRSSLACRPGPIGSSGFGDLDRSLRFSDLSSGSSSVVSRKRPGYDEPRGATRLKSEDGRAIAFDKFQESSDSGSEAGFLNRRTLDSASDGTSEPWDSDSDGAGVDTGFRSRGPMTMAELSTGGSNGVVSSDRADFFDPKLSPISSSLPRAIGAACSPPAATKSGFGFAGSPSAVSGGNSKFVSPFGTHTYLPVLGGRFSGTETVVLSEIHGLLDSGLAGAQGSLSFGSFNGASVAVKTGSYASGEAAVYADVKENPEASRGIVYLEEVVMCEESLEASAIPGFGDSKVVMPQERGSLYDVADEITAYLNSASNLVKDKIGLLVSILLVVLKGAKAIHLSRPEAPTHTDIKAENIFFGHGRLKLGDFGSVATFSDGAQPTLSSAAPELLQALLNSMLPKPMTPKMDVFSIGCLAYRLVTGAQLVDRLGIERETMGDAGGLFAPLSVDALNKFYLDEPDVFASISSHFQDLEAGFKTVMLDILKNTVSIKPHMRLTVGALIEKCEAYLPDVSASESRAFELLDGFFNKRDEEKALVANAKSHS